MKDTLFSKYTSGIICVVTGFAILRLLGWGANTAGKAAWKNHSRMAFFAFIFHNLPKSNYQKVKVKSDRT